MDFCKLREKRDTQYSRVPNKRACTPYLISTKLPPCPLLFGSARLFSIVNFSQIFRPKLDKFWLKLGIFSSDFYLFGFLHVQRVNKVSLIMNKTTKTARFHPALFLVFWAKFHPAGLFRTACLFDFCQNSTLHAFSACTLIRDTRV